MLQERLLELKVGRNLKLTARPMSLKEKEKETTGLSSARDEKDRK